VVSGGSSFDAGGFPSPAAGQRPPAAGAWNPPHARIERERVGSAARGVGAVGCVAVDRRRLVRSATVRRGSSSSCSCSCSCSRCGGRRRCGCSRCRRRGSRTGAPLGEECLEVQLALPAEHGEGPRGHEQQSHQHHREHDPQPEQRHRGERREDRHEAGSVVVGDHRFFVGHAADARADRLGTAPPRSRGATPPARSLHPSTPHSCSRSGGFPWPPAGQRSPAVAYANPPHAPATRRQGQEPAAGDGNPPHAAATRRPVRTAAPADDEGGARHVPCASSAHRVGQLSAPQLSAGAQASGGGPPAGCHPRPAAAPRCWRAPPAPCR